MEAVAGAAAGVHVGAGVLDAATGGADGVADAVGVADGVGEVPSFRDARSCVAAVGVELAHTGTAVAVAVACVG